MKSRPIIIDFETWCKLCSVLGVLPETSINDVIKKIEIRQSLLIKYRKITNETIRIQRH